MTTRASVSMDVLVIGAGPGALAIASALSNEGLQVHVLSANDHREAWPYTYGIWEQEVDELGLDHPISLKRMIFKAPLPKSFEGLLSLLRSQVGTSLQ